MTKIFVSYSRSDQQRVALLVERLRLHGFDVWWDDDIQTDQPWEETIEAALANAEVVIVCWSNRAVVSENVKAEARVARRQDRLLQIFLEPCEPPLFFGERQGIDLSDALNDPDHPAWTRLHARLDNVVRGETSSHSAPALGARAAHLDLGDRRSLVQRRSIIAGGIAALGAIGVGATYGLSRRSRRADPSTIAVLPFANLSGDPNQAYFSDGLAEELRDALSRLPGVQVVARTSSEILRNDSAVEAAKKLAVGHILIGSMRRSPKLIRVNAQLIDGVSGVEQWSQSYDRPSGDVLSIQSGIAQSVAQELSVELGVRGRAALTAGGTASAAAHDLYLKAEQRSTPGRAADARQALALVDAALEVDPRYAAAHTLRASTLALLAGSFASDAADSTATYKLAAAAARQAITLAPNFAEGHLALATILADQLHVREAVAEYHRAATLGASVNFFRRYGIFTSQLGRSAEAIALAQRAMSLDPLNARAIAGLGAVYYNARRFNDAIAAAQRSVTLAPGLKDGNVVLALSFLNLKQFGQAQFALRRLPTDDIYPSYPEAIIAAQQGDREASGRLIERLKQIGSDSLNFQFAEIYAQQGEFDQALAALAHAWAVQDPGLLNLRVSPFLDPLRPLPQFKALQAKLDVR